MPADGKFTILDNGKLAIRDSGKVDVCDDCCGGAVSPDDCDDCDTDTTPLTIELAFDGMVLCPTTTDCIENGTNKSMKWSDLVALQSPNSTVEVTQVSPAEPCRYREDVSIGNIDVYPSRDCTGTPTSTAVLMWYQLNIGAGDWVLRFQYHVPNAALAIRVFFAHSFDPGSDCIGAMPFVVDNDPGSPPGVCSDRWDQDMIADDSVGTCTMTAV